MVASESNPLIKTGGLGDVVYSLSKELSKMDEDVAIFLPCYESIKRKREFFNKAEYVTSFHVNLSWRYEEAKIYRLDIDGIKYYLIDNQRYFGREHLYGDFDDGERFAFFSIAAIEAFRQIGFYPNIVHIHDWQPGMIPCLAREWDVDYLRNTKFVLTIHNPAFQGLMPRGCLGDFYSLPDYLYDEGKVRFKDQVSTLKSAIIYADKITTVSPNHRRELLTPEGSMGLDAILRLREWDFVGILNGIDVDEFNPQTDKRIEMMFDKDSFLEGKLTNKKALLNKANVQYSDKALFAMVSRITWQKGMDILFPTLEKLLSLGHLVYVLGSGEFGYEQHLEDLRRRYPNNMAIYIGYNDELAHQIYAASDFFLMPSLFEPCGIGQMIAQRYGSLPIVRLTGGLYDTVIPYDGNNDDHANGFGFWNNNADEFRGLMDHVIGVYYNKPLMNKLVLNALSVDNSWRKSAQEYLDLYRSIII